MAQSGGDTPGVQSFTASEAISNGEVVSLLPNGQIASIGNTTLAAGTTAFASLPEVTDGDDYNNDWGKVVYDAGTGYFVALWSEGTGGTTVNARVYDVVESDLTFSGGSNAQVATSHAYFGQVVGRSDGAGTVLVVGRGGSSHNIKATPITINSDKTFTVGTTATIATYSGTSNHPFPTDVVYDPNVSKFVIRISRQDSNKNVDIFTCSVTGSGSSKTASSISSDQMSTHDYATELRPELMTYDATTNRVVHLYRNASGHPSAFIGTVASNGTISWGSSQTINNGAQMYFGAHAYNGKILAHVGTAEYAMGTRLCTIDASDNSFSSVGSFVTLPAWDSGSRTKSSSTVDTANGKVMVHWEAQKSGQYYEAYSIGTIGSSAVTYTSAALMNRWETNQSTATQLKSMLTGAYDSTNKVIVTAATRNSDGSMKLQARRTTAVSLGSNYADWIGIATAAISSGASGDVTILGGVSTNQSGLTAGTNYYVHTDGTLTATANDYPIGEALSATKLLIKGGVISGSTSVSHTLAADSGSNDTLTSGETLTFSGGAGIDTTVSDNTITTALNTEAVQDIVGAMFSSNTETGITATYEDSDGTIDLVATTSVSGDTSPSLGGNLDLGTNSIITGSSNNPVKIAPHGTGDVQLDTDTLRVGGSNENATITTQGTADLTLSTNEGTNAGTIVLADGANGNITLDPNGTGKVIIGSALQVGVYTLPATDGTSGQVLKTDGSGNLSWGPAPGTGIETLRQDGLVTVHTGTARWYVPADATITKIVARVNTAPVGATMNLTINKVSGGSTTTTSMSIAAGAYKAENNSPSLSLSYDDYITVDVTQVGSGEPGRDLQIIFTYTY